MNYHYLSLCCIIKDESNIEEFIMYYTILGVTKFYIYDNECSWRLKDRLNTCFFKNYCEIIDYPGKCKQMDAYNDCFKNYGHLTTWLIIVDGDEYILPKTKFRLTSFLEDHEDKHSIGINWVLFGTSFHDKKQSGYLIDNFRYCDDNQNNHIKVIVQPRYTININNPHFANMTDMRKFQDCKNIVIHKLAFNENHTIDIIQINHYTHKSLEESIEKHYRGNADSLNRRNIPDNSLHKCHNNKIDNLLPNNYLDLIKKMSTFMHVNWYIFKHLNKDLQLNNEEDTIRYIFTNCIYENRPLYIKDKFPNFVRESYRKEKPELNHLDDVWLEIEYINSH